ncbi:MAG: GNAT family N-acetyltransferase [Tissierellia bacterium]|nr:GNAT family N-acetyltransferase [Tissierellia bacterium]
MNKIKIKEDIIPEIEEIMNLYEDAEWYAYTKDRIRLKNAIDNSLKVLTAWENHKLVGLIRIVGDSHTIIYIQDILVLKEYQGQGIGSKLLSLILEKYKSIRQIVLMTDNTKETIGFYKKNGMVDTAEYNGVAFVKYNLN